VAPPDEIFFNPRNRVVSEFIGMPNILNCEHSSMLSSGLIEVRLRRYAYNSSV
jgi:ABC-type Fe3+/spermidine/putrescine transport system ATPase subunit